MRAKERLTGAIILVVLIVLIVPELLTGPRQADTQPDGMADEGAPLRSYTIELGERSSAKPARPLANRAAEPERQPAQHTEPPASAPPKTEAPLAPTLSPAKTAEPAKIAEDKVRESPPPAKRSTEAVPESGWSVQVGSFESRANADRLMSELRRLGFRTFITEGAKADHKLYRVRVGPEADRAATQALAERLRRAGHPGAIVPHP